MTAADRPLLIVGDTAIGLISNGDGTFSIMTSGSGGSGGGGTEYTEDAASAANPVGGAVIGRRRDTLSGSEVSTDGDNIALNATAKGELYTKNVDGDTKLDAIKTAVESLDASSPVLGTATSANSIPTTTASDDAIHGATNETAPATDTATSGLNGRLQRIAQRLTSLIAQLPATLGQKTAASSLSTTVASDDAIHGATNETAPISDTAASGLNGRLQRIAQRLTSLISLLPSALGQTNMAGSLSVAIANNQSAVAVTPGTTEVHLGQVGFQIFSLGVEVVRPADTTAYTAGDSVANATSSSGYFTFTSLLRSSTSANNTARLSGIRLITDQKSITPRFRVHLYNVNTITHADDNAVFKELYADKAKRIATIDLAAMTTPADTSGSDISQVEKMDLDIQIIAASGSRTIYALLETLDAFTPTSGQKFYLELTVVWN